MVAAKANLIIYVTDNLNKQMTNTANTNCQIVAKTSL